MHSQADESLGIQRLRAAELGVEPDRAAVAPTADDIRAQAPGTVHYFTVDVEEYFQVSALEPFVPRSGWSRLESRVANGVDRLLDLLDRYDAQATFFVLGWIAHNHPHVVRRIVERGHEVASHGWGHRRVTRQTPREFRRSARRSKAVLEEIIGEPVLGYRAPSFSIVPGLEWALDVLIEEGYVYDSSLYPVRRASYGYPNGNRDPHWLVRNGGRLFEVPPAVHSLWGKNLPAGGGGSLRLFPYAFIHSAVANSQRRGVPATIYVHPWEVDPEQPRFDVPWPTRVRHYGGLRRTMPRLQRLFSRFRFTAVRNALNGTSAG